MTSRKVLFDLIKRGVDIVVSAAGLIITAPIQIAVSAAVRINLGSPVLFRQQRPGKNERIFELLKFRTMLPVTEEQSTDEQRLTKFGKFLRSTSLDELPSLWNVLRGDMSLVGPRPLLVEYLTHYSPEQARRHEVRPGITGLAQVRGRNDVDWDRRFEYDVEYVDNRSIGLDLRILMETVTTVLKRSGINQEGHATMTPFSEDQKEKKFNADS
jgi:lipopolysaccharide/colanic/teichoic acid biosynthesis glycosyltransferase